MCLELTRKQRQFVIADQDITVWKWLKIVRDKDHPWEKSYKSPYADVDIPEDGILANPKDNRDGDVRTGRVRQPLKNIRTSTIFGRIFHRSTYLVSIGFHSYSSEDFALANSPGILHFKKGQMRLVKGVIPKGTAYVTNGDELASEALILKL